MSTPNNNPFQEHPSTYMVQNLSDEEEMTRLQIQDQMITAGMGGVLPEQADPTSFQRVLDVGCGTGGWLIETALTWPPVNINGTLPQQCCYTHYTCYSAPAS